MSEQIGSHMEIQDDTEEFFLKMLIPGQMYLDFETVNLHTILMRAWWLGLGRHVVDIHLEALFPKVPCPSLRVYLSRKAMQRKGRRAQMAAAGTCS